VIAYTEDSLGAQNGIAVGGKQRFTITPKLVCASYGSEETAPWIFCLLAQSGVREKDGTVVRKLPLNVEAILTVSVLPSPCWKPN